MVVEAVTPSEPSDSQMNTDSNTMAVATPSSRTQALLDACADGNLDRLRSLLDDPAVSAEALSEVDSTGRGKTRKIINLRNLVEKAAKESHAEIVAHLFAFAREHSVDAETLISRETLLAATGTGHVDVVSEFVKLQPSCVNTVLGYSGDPLARAIIGNFLGLNDDTNPETRIPLVRYLLENGADPNQPVCSFTKPGFHLYTATLRRKPLEMIRLLLAHGAQVKGTGAAVAAAGRGRIDVLELLLEHGADVHEPLAAGIAQAQEREETPIEAARRNGQDEAVRWLQSHGAE